MVGITRSEVRGPLGIPASLFTGQIPGNAGGGGSPSYADELVAVSDHLWLLNETTGTFADSVGGATLSADNAACRGVNGPIRGAPYQRAINLSGNSAAYLVGTTEFIADSLAGTLGAWVRVMGSALSIYPGGSDVIGVIGQEYANNGGVRGGLGILNDGSVIARFQAGGSNFAQAITAAGVIQPYLWYFLVVAQRNDGTGMHIFVNGVEVAVTRTQGGTFDLNSWFADVAAQFSNAPTEHYVGANGDVGNNTSEAFRQFYGAFVNESQGLSDAVIANLFTAADLTSVTDWYEYVFDLMPDLWFSSGIISAPYGTSNECSNLGLLRFEIRQSGAVQANANLPGPLTTNYNANDAKRFDNSTSETLFAAPGTLNTNELAVAGDDTTGTWFFLVRPVSPLTSRRWFLSIGQFNDYMSFGHNSSGQWEVTFSIGSGSGTYTQAVTGAGLGVVLDQDYSIAVTQDGVQMRIYINGVLIDLADVTETVTGAGVSAASWHSVLPNLNNWRNSGRAGSSSSNRWLAGLLSTQLYFSEQVLSAGDIANLDDAYQGNLPAADIAEFIAGLNADHLYKADEASGDVLDSGQASAVDLTPFNGTLLYQQGGPDPSTESIDANGAWPRSDSLPFSSAATGTVLGFVRGLNNAETILCQSNTVNEVNTLAFGMNPQSVVANNRIGVVLSTSSFLNRRGWHGDTDVSTWGADGLWHLIGFVQTGSGMRINVDGIEQTVTEVTNGTPPASTSWFAQALDANSRAVMCNNRYSTISGRFTDQFSNWVILDGVIVTPKQFAQLAALINP